MELILARQSVMIKCNMQSSIMMGNYEFYYAGGLLCRLAGRIPEQAFQPHELYDFLEPLLADYKPQNQQETYLVKLLKGYKPEDTYDEQMAQLLAMGLKEKHIWK